MLSFNNNKNGTYKIFCKNSGKLILKKNYSKNLLDGRYTYYWENGQVRFSGLFVKNRRKGIWINYDKNGRIIFEEKF